MSFFDLFRILYATHFVLGIPVAFWCLYLLIYNPLIAAFVSPHSSKTDVIVSVVIGTLTYLWYYVWYGSIVFSIKRRFPLLSIRVFSVVLAIVYGGIGFSFVFPSKPGLPQAMENPFVAIVIGTMLVIAMCGMLFLPTLKVASDDEEQRIHERRHRQLDDLHPWGSKAEE